MEISKVRKRDGRIVQFNKNKIVNAINKAFLSVGLDNKDKVEKLADEVVDELLKIYDGDIIHVEQIQDVVEKILIKNKLTDVAKSYILYRQKHKELREVRSILGVEDDLKLPINSLKVLRARYLLKNEKGEIIETPKQLFKRVANAVAEADRNYTSSEEEVKKTAKKFYKLMSNLEFLPNSPTLFNAGTNKKLSLSACFVPEQLIVGNPKIKEIKEFKPGDKVLTHLGEMKPIMNIFKRKIKQNILKIKVQGIFNETLSVTEEHPILGIKKEMVQCLRVPKRICNGVYKKYCYKLKNEYRESCPYLKNYPAMPEWIFAKDLEEGDFVATVFPSETVDVEKIRISDYLPENRFYFRDNYIIDKYRKNTGKLIPNEIEIDEDFMKLVGYWLAEGSLSERYKGKGYSTIKFTFSTKEQRYADEVLNIMKRKFNLTARKEINKEQHTIQLRFHSNLVATFWGKLFGAGFDKKELPEWIIYLPKEKQFNLLVGLFRGDGCYHLGKKQDRVFISLSNKQLALKIWNILGRLGFYFNIYKYKPKLGTKEAYRISTAPSECEDLVKAAWNKYKVRKSFPQYLKIGNMILRPIKKIEKEFYEGYVYNFEVERDHSYAANNVVVHNCFVLPVGDSMEEIFEAVKNMALVQMAGGGTGFSFSRLRPKGDIVRSTMGHSSGPISFMRVFNVATDVIIQGGRRRGANMGVLRVDHPDILEFISCKEKNNEFTNFNLSVAVTDKFMEAVEKNEDYELINPRTKKVVKKLNARKVFSLIATFAWKNGDPGLIFIDEINRYNPTPEVGEIEATNPCVTGDTFVSTEHGLIRMKDLVEKYSDGGLKIATDNRVPIQIMDRRGNIYLMQRKQKGLSFNQISRAFCTGIKKVYKLVTESGYELEATGDHKILTTDGFIELKDINIKRDKVLIQSGEGKFSDNYDLPFKVRNGCRLNLPKRWSIELGQVLGYLVGDGWLREDRKNCRVGFTFGKEDIEILNYLKPIINNFYGKEIKEVKRSNGTIHLSYHSKYFVDFFKKLGVKPVKADKKEVPASIFTAPKEVVVGFLQGLFSADGTIGIYEPTKNYYIRLTSKSEKLLKEVQLLLLNLGIKSRIYNSRKNLFKYKNKKGEICTYGSDILFELNISRENIPKFIKKIGFLVNKNKNKIQKLDRAYYSDKFEDKIKEIKYVGEKKVYDLTEPKTLSFITNGFLSLDCGEQPLLPYESCNLGSINLSKMVKKVEDKYEIDWKKLKDTVETAVHFLDNIIDINVFPIKEIEKATKANRKIGLGVMGFADLLILLEIPYDSEEAEKLAEEIMKFITETARNKSRELGKLRGNFPNIRKSIWKNEKYMRNATVTTIAPTGSIGIIANCSSGIEPIFAISYMRNVANSLGENLVETNQLFERILREKGLYNEKIIRKVAGKASIQDILEIPENIRKIFVSAHDVSPKWHLRIQAAFQKHTDNAVSKCITGDSIILTEKGMLTLNPLIKNLPEDSFANTNLKVMDKDKEVLAKQFYYGGKRKIIKLKTKKGFAISGTPNHRIKIIDKNGIIRWEYLENIKKGDYCLIAYNQNYFGNAYLLKEVYGDYFKTKLLTNSKNVKIPIKITKDFGRFLGYHISDGSLNKNSILFSQNKNEILDDYVKLVKKLFKVNVTLQKDNRRKNLYNAVTNSKALVRFLKDYIGVGTNSKTKKIPKCIYMAGKEIIEEFIKGLTLDGYVSKKRVCPITTVSKELARGVHLLLANLGIISSLRRKKINNGYSYEVVISGKYVNKYLDKIGFAENRKNNLAKEIKRNLQYDTSDIIPNVKNLVKKLIIKKRNACRSEKLKIQIKSLLYGKEISRENLIWLLDICQEFSDEEEWKKLKEVVNQNIFFDKIDEIGYGEEKVYDLFIPETNSFIANGFVNHNTINLPNSATIQDIEEIYMLAWKMKCKGITVYRDRSREEQVISFYSEDKKEEKNKNDICPNCGEKMVREEGCKICKSCGYSVCS
ncbi:MAG: hypothetical protein DRP10_02300 [Candidatus Aenigmatarchaeota archaeon]|nr:MAG: hypothetical protein DRP10_02300 [Candidatus Aenigmarchaeota archaeon]